MECGGGVVVRRCSGVAVRWCFVWWCGVCVVVVCDVMVCWRSGLVVCSVAVCGMVVFIIFHLGEKY